MASRLSQLTLHTSLVPYSHYLHTRLNGWIWDISPNRCVVSLLTIRFLLPHLSWSPKGTQSRPNPWGRKLPSLYNQWILLALLSKYFPSPAKSPFLSRISKSSYFALCRYAIAHLCASVSLCFQLTPHQALHLAILPLSIRESSSCVSTGPF